MFPKKAKSAIRGTVVIDRKTKQLLKRIRPGQIAILDHEDIDEIAARDLVAARVKAVVNMAQSMSGSYMSVGAKILLHHGIPLFDCERALDSLQDGDLAEIRENLLICRSFSLHLRVVTEEEIMDKMKLAERNLQSRLNQFVDNTLSYANKEKDYYSTPLPNLPLKVKIRSRHVLIVVRGKHYREDLRAIRSYIEDYRPILIGVDGGADALLEEGWKPDIIIGDMDSISDHALRTGAEIIVHAYPDGHAPASSRLDSLGVIFHVLPASGTSEDVAMLFAYEQGADWIVALGAHSNMIDFLEKGRKGMASTVLVRMKMGMKLIDAKGVSMLYQKRVKWKNFFFLSSAAAVPAIAASIISPAVRQFWHLLWLQLKYFIM
ncbi:putative cytokinetic ring protein SteA [Ammoniphilus sp. YIM 78166]|uniref:putative cytokinetic ring protein SteA n=1 Tax=Ammoniphilus sp. YIM 78166 TaxID=1644106 RepID=UPI001F0D4624|nr:putative cytokinetic ring protein SteA [Ammoniphilus sp. YIM 78166]